MITKQKKLLVKFGEKARFLKQVKSVQGNKENSKSLISSTKSKHSLDSILEILDKDPILNDTKSLTHAINSENAKEITPDSKISELLQEFVQNSRIRSKDPSIQKSIPFFEILKGTFIEDCSNQFGSDFMGSTIENRNTVEQIMSLTQENEALYHQLQNGLQSEDTGQIGQ